MSQQQCHLCLADHAAQIEMVRVGEVVLCDECIDLARDVALGERGEEGWSASTHHQLCSICGLVKARPIPSYEDLAPCCDCLEFAGLELDRQRANHVPGDCRFCRNADSSLMLFKGICLDCARTILVPGRTPFEGDARYRCLAFVNRTRRAADPPCTFCEQCGESGELLWLRRDGTAAICKECLDVIRSATAHWGGSLHHDGDVASAEASGIRVFISSTFADMKAERDALHELVFPALTTLARRLGAGFRAVDLRWGVSADAAENHQTMQICLDELGRCVSTSPRMSLLALLGDRYGSRLLPAIIPDATMRRLRDHLNAADDELVSRWYSQDNNAVHGEHRLRPFLSSSDEQAASHSQAYQAMQAALAKAAEGAGFTDVERLPFHASATEQELEHWRSLTGGAASGAAVLLTTAERPDPDDEDSVALARVRNMIRESLGSAAVSVPVDGDRQTHIGKLPEDAVKRALRRDFGSPDTLCEAVWFMLAPKVIEQADDAQQQDPVQRERELHERTVQVEANRIVGRDAALAEVAEYLTASETSCTLTIEGDPGIGRTAFMANAVAAARRADPSALVVSRFVGATPDSVEATSLVSGLCAELALLRGEAYTRPGDYEATCIELISQLTRATSQQPIWLFIDGVEKLLHPEGHAPLRWLPADLPERAHVILSVTTDDADHGPPRGAWRQALARRSWRFVNLPALAPDVATKLFAGWLDERGRRLQPDQWNTVERWIRACPRPRYLRALLTEVARWRGDETGEDLIAPGQSILVTGDSGVVSGTEGRGQLFEVTLPAADEPPDKVYVQQDGVSLFLADEGPMWVALAAISAMAERRLEALVRAHGPHIVDSALGLLFAARDGLTEEELLAALSAEKPILQELQERSPEAPPVKQLPEIIWARLRTDLGEDVKEHSEGDGTLLLTLEPGPLLDLMQRRWKTVPRRFHRRLATQFLAPDASPRRRARERTHHLIRAKDYESAVDELTDLSLLVERIGAGDEHQTSRDLLTITSTLERPSRATESLCDFVRRNVGRFSTLLEPAAQLLANSTDDPELLRQAEVALSGLTWFRRIDRSANKPQTTPSLEITAQTHPCVVISSTGRNLFVAEGNQVRMWDLATNELTKAFDVDVDRIMRLTLSGDGQQLLITTAAAELLLLEPASGSRSGRQYLDEIPSALALNRDGSRVFTVVGGKLRAFQQLYRPMEGIEADAGDVGALVVTADDELVVAASDKTLVVWRTEDLTQVATEHHEYAITALTPLADARGVAYAVRGQLCRWTPSNGSESIHSTDRDLYQSVVSLSGTLIACLGSNLSLFDASTGELKASVPLASLVSEMVGAGEHVVTWRTNRVRVWTVPSLLQAAASTAAPRDGFVATADGRWLALRKARHHLEVWEPGGRQPAVKLMAKDQLPIQVAAHPDSRSLIVSYHSGILRLWDLDTGRCLQSFRGHGGIVTGLAVAPDAGSMVSYATDEFRIWRLPSGRLFHVERWFETATNPELALSPDAALLAVDDGDRTVVIWSLADRQEVTRLSAPAGVTSLAFSRTGKTMWIGQEDGGLSSWDLEKRRCCGVADVASSGVIAVEPMVDDVHLLTLDLHGILRLHGTNEDVIAACEMDFTDAANIVLNGRDVWVQSHLSGGAMYRIEGVNLGKAVATAWNSPIDRQRGVACPICHHWMEIPRSMLSATERCHRCASSLRVNAFTLTGDWASLKAAWEGEPVRRLGLSKSLTVLQPEQMNDDELLAILTDAFEDVSQDDDGHPRVRKSYGCTLILGKDNLCIQTLFGLTETTDLAAQFEYANRVNKRIVGLRAALLSGDLISFDHTLLLKGGVTRAQIAATVDRFFRLLQAALDEDTNDVIRRKLKRLSAS